MKIREKGQTLIKIRDKWTDANENQRKKDRR